MQIILKIEKVRWPHLIARVTARSVSCRVFRFARAREIGGRVDCVDCNYFAIKINIDQPRKINVRSDM